MSPAEEWARAYERRREELKKRIAEVLREIPPIELKQFETKGMLRDISIAQVLDFTSNDDPYNK